MSRILFFKTSERTEVPTLWGRIKCLERDELPLTNHHVFHANSVPKSHSSWDRIKFYRLLLPRLYPFTHVITASQVHSGSSA